jgi:hypothetical protein
VTVTSETRRNVLVFAAVFATAFLYQFATPRFSNDHFDHLSKAVQVLHGEYPLRDFLDPGRPLTILLSAAALALSGGALFGEALLTMGAIAAGIALGFLLTREITGSTLFAGWAAACTLAIEPRLYAYPKVLVCVVATWLAFRYIDKACVARAAGLGAWAGVGFLMRHDLGVYLAVFAVATLLLSSRRSDPRGLYRDAAVAAGVAFALVAPYLWFMLQQGALAEGATEGGGALWSAVRLTLRPFQLGARVDGGAWLRQDAETWVYDLFLVAPIVTLLLVAHRRARLTPQLRKGGALAVLCGTLLLFLIRGNLDSRLPDVAAPSFVLVAWVLATMWGSPQEWRASTRRTAQAVAAFLVACVTGFSVVQLSDWNPVRRLASAVVRLPGSVMEPAALLRGDPLLFWEREGTEHVRGLARWMRVCTSPDDRLLIFGYHPDAHFYSRRLFAGGVPMLYSGYYASPRDQRFIVDRLGRQRVPFVVVDADGVRAMEDSYAIVGAYVRNHYSLAAQTDFGGPPFLIYRANVLPGPLRTRDGLPCLTREALVDTGAQLDAEPAARESQR